MINHYEFNGIITRFMGHVYGRDGIIGWKRLGQTQPHSTSHCNRHGPLDTGQRARDGMKHDCARYNIVHCAACIAGGGADVNEVLGWLTVASKARLISFPCLNGVWLVSLPSIVPTGRTSSRSNLSQKQRPGATFRLHHYLDYFMS